MQGSAFGVGCGVWGVEQQGHASVHLEDTSLQTEKTSTTSLSSIKTSTWDRHACSG